MRKWFRFFFLLAGILTILEYGFVCGIFTSLMTMALVLMTGIANLFYAIREKDYHSATLYVLCTIALNMGYWKLMF